jgi:hypothetical protein
MDSGAERMVRLAMLTMMLMRFDFLRLLLRGMTQHLMQLHLMMLLYICYNMDHGTDTIPVVHN